MSKKVEFYLLLNNIRKGFAMFFWNSASIGIYGKIDKLFFCFSFEQEENEMKMMSCIFDDEEGESSSSNSYGDQQNFQDPKKKLNFIKKKNNVTGQKVQRSASAIFRSKVYAVVARKQKKSRNVRENEGNRKYKTLELNSLF